MAQNVVIAGATFLNAPAVDIPKSGGGTARFYDEQGTLTVTGNGTVSVTGYANVTVAIPVYDGTVSG